MRRWTWTAAAAFALTAATAPAAAQGDSIVAQAAQSRAKGSESAPVVVYEIADFQCPYCGRFAREIFPRLDSAYVRTGKVRWVFVNLPLPNHRHAWPAAEAALCSGAVAERFWPMHDRLFASVGEWAEARDLRAVLQRYAREAGVPEAAYRECVDSDAVAMLLLDDVLRANAAGVQGTPTFFVGEDNQRLVGMQPFEVWQEMLDKALEKAEAARTRAPEP